MTESLFDPKEIKKGALVIRALNHKLRQKLLTLLDQEGPLTVTEIFQFMRLQQSVTSQHLRILRQARLVVSKPDGKFQVYNINKPRLEEVNKLVQQLIGEKENEPIAIP